MQKGGEKLRFKSQISGPHVDYVNPDNENPIKKEKMEKRFFLVGCAAPLCHSITTSRSWAGYTQTNITQKTKKHPKDKKLKEIKFSLDHIFNILENGN